ncbi:MAG: hypothetical protein ABIR71_05260, partial [Chthoniobacterales bacterium]
DFSGFRVCAALRGPLAKFMGAAGVDALFSRALALTGAEIPWLRQLRVGADGALDGLAEMAEKLDAPALAEGEIALVGHLLGLLVIFIGPTLTLALLHDIWPGWTIEMADPVAL